MGKFIDLTGQKFERLRVIERAENAKNGRVQWLCECRCGNMVIVRASDLMHKGVKSCGCLRKETAVTNGKTQTTHGLRRTRLYKEWIGIKTRCYNQNDPNYKGYGARGITMCEEWRNDFVSFYTWAMENGYNETAPRGVCTLERKNNDGPYSPDNCKWATNAEQQNNKRNNRRITYNGETKTVPQWAAEIGINPSTIHSRLNSGWSVEKTLTDPLHEEKRRK